jgi:hypothetical protein
MKSKALKAECIPTDNLHDPSSVLICPKQNKQQNQPKKQFSAIKNQ